MNIDGKKIQRGERAFLIAEVSANHNGSLERAKETILAARNAGADAVKIQTYKPDTITINCDSEEFILKDGIWAGRKLYELYEEAHTPYEWHQELFRFARKNGIILFSSPFDASAVDLLEELNTPAYKIASFEIVDHPLIEYIASTGKPILMSTGAASMDEIASALRVARRAGAGDILLFHCISAYPAQPEDSNLNSIKFLEDEFGVLIGLSDHTLGTEVAHLAYALGAVAIEKHFTLTRDLGGPDSSFSSEPKEFKVLRRQLDLSHTLMGTYGLVRSASESQSSSVRKSIYFTRDKKAGSTISEDDVKVIRPGGGIHPKYFKKVIGSTVSKDVKFGDSLTFEVLAKDKVHFDTVAYEFELVRVEPSADQVEVLYDILKWRSNHISHVIMPSFTEHSNFVNSNPYRGWWIVRNKNSGRNIIGSCYLQYDNSVGLHLNFDFVGFTAIKFLSKLKMEMEPLSEEKSLVYRDYYFNVSPYNKDLIRWLKDAKMKITQLSLSPPSSYLR